LPTNFHQNGTLWPIAGEQRPIIRQDLSAPTASTTAAEQAYREQAAVAVAAQHAAEESVVPEDARLFGIVGSRRYYPIEMLLDLISNEQDLDIVYFRTEEEALAAGFTAAN